MSYIRYYKNLSKDSSNTYKKFNYTIRVSGPQNGLQLMEINETGTLASSLYVHLTTYNILTLVIVSLCSFNMLMSITSIINQQLHLRNFHIKHFKPLKITPACFNLVRSSSRSFVVPCESYITIFTI